MTSSKPLNFDVEQAEETFKNQQKLLKVEAAEGQVALAGDGEWLRKKHGNSEQLHAEGAWLCCFGVLLSPGGITGILQHGERL